MARLKNDGIFPRQDAASFREAFIQTIMQFQFFFICRWPLLILAGERPYMDTRNQNNSAHWTADKCKSGYGRVMQAWQSKN